MVVFTVFFQRVAKVDTGGGRTPCSPTWALLPWTFFSTSVNQGGQSLLTNNQLVNKVYCPREVFPLASMAVAAVDSLLATLVLGLLFAITGFDAQADLGLGAGAAGRPGHLHLRRLA